MKGKKRLSAPKPRDPFFLAMRKRKNGSHTQSPKAIRQREKSKLRKNPELFLCHALYACIQWCEAT